MNRKLKIWLCAAVLAAANGVSVGAWAMGPQAEGTQPDPGRIMAQMGEKLDLSADQQAKIKELTSAARQQPCRTKWSLNVRGGKTSENSATSPVMTRLSTRAKARTYAAMVSTFQRLRYSSQLGTYQNIR